MFTRFIPLASSRGHSYLVQLLITFPGKFITFVVFLTIVRFVSSPPPHLFDPKNTQTTRKSGPTNFDLDINFIRHEPVTPILLHHKTFRLRKYLLVLFDHREAKYLFLDGRFRPVKFTRVYVTVQEICFISCAMVLT